MRCPSCKISQTKFLEKVGNYKIYHCPNCELDFPNPMESPSREWYEKTLVDKTAMIRPQVWGKWQKQIYNFFIEKEKLGRTLLDIGSGDGVFLNMARGKGYQVAGIEFNRILALEAEQNFKLKIYPMSLENFHKQFPRETFDAITFFEVLEHMSNPDQFISTVKNHLNPNGYIALSVPNRDRSRLSSKRYPTWDFPPHHFTWWSANALKYFLTMRGFQIIELKELKRKLQKRDAVVEGPYIYALAMLK